MWVIISMFDWLTVFNMWYLLARLRKISGFCVNVLRGESTLFFFSSSYSLDYGRFHHVLINWHFASLLTFESSAQ